MRFFGASPSLENGDIVTPDVVIQMAVDQSAMSGSHSSHPTFVHLVLLVFEAVLEVVCVSLPGYIAARQGMFDADAQKFVANLNVALFTPCLSMSCPPFLSFLFPFLFPAS